MKARPHDIIADDDPALRELLAGYLHEHANARAGLAPAVAARARAADVLLIDMTPSRRDGARACRILHPRADLSALILEAIDVDESARAKAGATSRAAAPSTAELMARVRTLRGAPTRTARSAAQCTVARFAGWTLELATRRLTDADGSARTMPPTQFALLGAFLEQPRRTLSREALAARVRTRGGFTSERTLDVYVSRLRRLLRGGASGPNVIGTRRNEGYALDADAVFD